MFGVYLKGALQEPGCPICRLRREAEARYLFHILWENVNDGGFRQRFLASEGLCPEHAWQLQATETRLWHDGLGNGILYESLLRAVGRMVRDQRTAMRRQVRPWWHPARWLKRPSPPRLPPPESCPVCESGDRTAQFYAHEAGKRLEEGSWRDAYRASDGMCWPHLRPALMTAGPGARQWLLAETDRRLTLLQDDLSEYLRKHSWQFRDEPVPAAESQSWIRAIAFLRGEKPVSEETAAP